MNKIDLIRQEFPKQYRDYAKEIYGAINGVCRHPVFGGRIIHCHSTLYTLIKILRPTTVLEIGSWRYDSANIMARAMQDCDIDGQVYTFDVKMGGYSSLRRAPGRPEFDNIHAMFWYPHHTSESKRGTYNNDAVVFKQFQSMTNDEIFQANLRILADIRPTDGFDFIFIDGDHSFEGITFDWAYAQQMSRPDTVICIDDLSDNRIPWVRYFWDRLTTYKYEFDDWNANPQNDLTLDGVTYPELPTAQ